MRLSFAEYIRKIPSSTLFSHTLIEQKSGVLSEQVYNSIAESFIEQEKLDKLWQELSLDERQLLFSVYLCGESGFVIEDNKIQKLIASFLVYETIGTGGEKRLVGFPDLDHTLFPYFSQIQTEFVPSSPSPTLYRPLVDIIAVLDAVRFGKITLKQTGEISKGSVDFLFSSTGLSTLSDTYPLQAAFVETVLEVLSNRGEIVLQGQMYHLSHSGMQFAGKCCPAVELYEAFSSASSVGNLPFITAFLNENNSIVFSEDNLKSRAVSVATMLLRWFNTIEEIGENAYKMKSALVDDIRVSTGHIMPDYTVFIPPEIELEAFFKILSVANLERVDMIYHARLDRQKVVSSLAMGILLSDIIEILQEWHAAESILHTVQEWGASFGQLYMDKGTFLAVADSQVDTVTSLTEIREYLEETQSYTMYKVRPGSEGFVKKHLSERGYDLRKPEISQIPVLTDEEHLSKSVSKPTPNFAPQIDASQTESQGRVGRYGGTPRRLSLEEIQKVVRYAQLMDEWLMIFLKEHEKPVVIQPKQLRSGDNGVIEGVDKSGEVHHIEFTTIDRMGVIPHE